MVMIVRSTAKSCATENYDLCQKFQVDFFAFNKSKPF